MVIEIIFSLIVGITALYYKVSNDDNLDYDNLENLEWDDIIKS